MTSVYRACAWTYSSITKQNEATCYEEKLARTELFVITDLILSEEYPYKQENDVTNRNKHSIAGINRIIQYWCTNGSIV